MRSTRQRLAAATLLAGLTTLGVGLSAGPAMADVNTDCQSFLAQAQSGSLHLTSSPAANSAVPVGSTISLSGSWDDQAYRETDKFFICTTVNGNYSSALSSVDRGVDNNGSYSGAAAVPASTPVGSDICIVSALRGQAQDKTTLDSVSEKLCYTAAAVVTTTTQAPTTTTTAAPAVEPNVIEAGDPAPVLEVAPAPVEAPAPLPVLPRTGAGLDLLAGFGGLALAAGGTASFFGRRRPSEG